MSNAWKSHQSWNRLYTENSFETQKILCRSTIAFENEAREYSQNPFFDRYDRQTFQLQLQRFRCFTCPLVSNQ